MHYYGLVQAFEHATLMDIHFAEARKALLQPGIQVENTGTKLSQYGVPMACLNVTFADKTNQNVMIGTHYIDQILEDPKFPKGFSEVRTTLCLAREKATQYAVAEYERRERELDESFAKFKDRIKTGLKRLLSL